MKIKQLVFLMIIVLIVFSLIELVFVQTPNNAPQTHVSIASTHILSTTPVDEWQLYENEKYGNLQMGYPSEWQIITDEFTPTTESVSGKQDEPESFEQNASITLFDDKTISVTGYEAMGHAVMGLDVYANRWASPEDFLTATLKANEEPSEVRFPFAKIVGETEVSGQRAIIFTWSNIVDEGLLWSVAFVKDDWLYIFSTWPKSNSGQELSAQSEDVTMLNEILDTVKVVGKSIPVSHRVYLPVILK